MGIFGGGGPRDPTEKLSVHQLLYIFVINGLGGFIISGGINFAVAYGMYARTTEPIWLFQLPTTLLGDAGVTTILQSIITWLITVLMVNGDLRSGGVAPIGFVKQPKNRLIRWFMFLDPEDSAPVTKVETGKEEGCLSVLVSRFSFIRDQALRGFIFSIPFFAVMVGPTVGILISHGTRSGGDFVYPQIWTPQIFKLLYGGILGLFMSPLYVLFWTVRCGWAMQRGETHYGETWRTLETESLVQASGAV
ncbi:uncharacterized protein B0I36DRAFT_365409 [Microdochium trichocladiopsis]|uniref:Uncharacterized protein n=1 Tax=Microdochium trichocladiopsis TaxID=1682393 RepID=A0A9P9BLY9_9PEZI|nr:uncharacterized protein B0I36DRAFT_365409 [Microdochium trichocladiopsis]KAH7025738.1 hypothetical protein B0I36DRAFT_365409 [Microdochium trichocladiopsis]